MGETKTLLTPRLRMKGMTTGSLSVEAHEGRIFALNTPPGTWVFLSESRINYGITVPNTGVYINPKDHTVMVSHVNKRGGPTTLSINNIVNMNDEDKAWHNIV